MKLDFVLYLDGFLNSIWQIDFFLLTATLSLFLVCYKIVSDSFDILFALKLLKKEKVLPICKIFSILFVFFYLIYIYMYLYICILKKAIE